MSQVRIDELIPHGKLLASGHLACPGCAAPLAMKLALKALGPKSSVVYTALYTYARTGTVPQAFHPDLIRNAFVQK